jgi:hypothetical protein
MDTRLRASLRHGRPWIFKFFLFSDPPQGRPFGDGGSHRTWWRGETISALSLNTTIFMGKEYESILFITNHENYLQTRVTRFRASPRHGGVRKFFLTKIIVQLADNEVRYFVSPCQGLFSIR